MADFHPDHRKMGVAEMKESLRFAGRSVRWTSQRCRARLAALDRQRKPSPPIFIVGCGRSGTTFFGTTLAQNANVVYFEEPRARWHLIEERTDEIGLFGHSGTLCLNASDVNARNLSYIHLFFPNNRNAYTSIVIDKTPAHVFRLEWLAALYPGAKFINIVRDGDKVISSILRRCMAPRYQVSWSDASNQWWGRNECKKHLILQTLEKFKIEIEPRGKFNDTDFAALEWILSICSSNHFKDQFPENLIDVNFDQFLENPEKELHKISLFAGTPCVSALIDFVLSKRTRYTEEQTLPDLGFARRDVRVYYQYMQSALNEQFGLTK